MDLPQPAVPGGADAMRHKASRHTFFTCDAMKLQSRQDRTRALHLAEFPRCEECRRKGRRVSATVARLLSYPVRLSASMSYRAVGLVSLCDIHDRGDDQ